MNRNSKLAGPNRSASRWTSWHRRITPTVYPQRNVRDISDSGMSHWTNRARMRRCDFDQTFELQLQSRTVSIENQARKSHNPFLTNNIGDGTLLPQAILGGTGTRPKAGGAHEFDSFFIQKNMFVAAGFVYSWSQSTVTDGRWRQRTSHVTFFSRTMRVLNNVLHNTLAQVSARARHVICMVIHVVRFSVLWLSVPHFVLFRMFLLSLLLLPGHYPVPLPACGRHQGN